jgi:hypothetical protein
MKDMTDTATKNYTTKPLSADTWADFERLVEDNNGVWGDLRLLGHFWRPLRTTRKINSSIF